METAITCSPLNINSFENNETSRTSQNDSQLVNLWYFTREQDEAITTYRG